MVHELVPKVALMVTCRLLGSVLVLLFRTPTP